MFKCMFNIFQYYPKQLHNFLWRIFWNSSASFYKYIPVLVETSGACMHRSVETDTLWYFFQTKLCSWMKWAFHIQMSNCFRNQYLIRLKRMFGDRNVHKTFSAVNLTIICIKPFTSNYTTFSSILLKCRMKHYFFIKHCLLNTSSLFWTAFKKLDWTVTD